MKNLKSLLCAALLAFVPAAVMADGYDLATKNINEFKTYSSAPATNDKLLMWDNSAQTFVRLDATAPLFEDATINDDLTVTDSLAAEDLTVTRAPSADSATTNTGVDINLTAPVDTTGTNTHNALNVDLTISNATGGTNSVRGVHVSNVTGDAQVDVTGVNIGTGTRLGTSRAVVIGTGWDTGLDVTNTAAADSGTTEMGIDVNLTTPVDTTGTNIHYGLNIDTTIGNATGGTNTATAINIANVTGDAQVTETGVAIGTGFDTGLSVASPVSITSTVTGDGGDALVGFLQSQVASTTTSATIAQCGVTFVSNSADVITLPEASTALGCRYTFVCGTADDFDVNPADGTDQIGTVASITGSNTTTVLAPAAGDAIRCTDIGSSIVLEAVAADLWVSIGTANGIWTDVN